MAEKYNPTLAENLLTLLCWSDEHGRLVHALADPALFEGDYRLIAERAVEYWNVHKAAPAVHTPDLFADILHDERNRRRKTFERIIISMEELVGSLNTVYILDQLRKFTRLQKMKDAILKSAERLNARQHLAIEEVEAIWNDLLRSRDIAFESGTYLDEYTKLIEYMRQREVEFDLGIKELDNRRATPARQTVLLFLGAAGRGKSWFLIQVGKRALLRRKKVLAITLELSEEQILQRYYQSLFSVPKREAEEVYLTSFELDKERKIETIHRDRIESPFALDDPNLVLELDSRIVPMSTRYRNLIIKRFPPRSLTPTSLRAYMDNLEITEGFIPDMLTLDYVGRMKTDEKNHRISLGNTFEELRAIAIERNISVATAHQVSRKAVQSGTTQSTHVAEDWSMIGTADVVLAYSCTDQEFAAGLGRLYVAKNRDEEDRYGVALTQNYALGQFSLQSVPLSKKYVQASGDFLGNFGDNTEDDDDDDED